jgi:3-oxoadipate enol-lactonase
MEATIEGAKLHYEDTGGAGLAVVLIHGFPFSSRMWASQVQALSKAGFRAISYDVRGHGASDVGDGLYTIEQFADDLLGLLAHLKIERAALCGVSMGGYIALRAAEKAPEKVRALVLCDTRSEADANKAKALRAGAMKVVAQKGVPFFADDFAKNLFSPMALAAGAPCVESIKALMKRNTPTGVRGALLALAARPDATEFLPSIKAPTLILVGEHDSLTPPAMSESMQRAIPGAQLHVIPNAGHLACVEQPQEFNGLLVGFLSALSKTS